MITSPLHRNIFAHILREAHTLIYLFVHNSFSSSIYFIYRKRGAMREASQRRHSHWPDARPADGTQQSVRESGVHSLVCELYHAQRRAVWLPRVSHSADVHAFACTCVRMYDYHIATSIKTLAPLCVCVRARGCAHAEIRFQHEDVKVHDCYR